MNKGNVRRSQFMVIQLSTLAVFKSVAIEADEVYVTQVTPSTVGMQIRRQRERDLKAAMTQFVTDGGTTLGGIATQEWNAVDLTYGRVPLDTPPTSDGKLMNRPVTTAANDLTQAERFTNANVGFKETVDFRSSTESSQATVIIELVHYVPAELISA